MFRSSLALVAFLFPVLAFAEARITLHCTEMDAGAGYPATVNLIERDGKKFGSFHPHGYADTGEPFEAELTHIDQNGPETWFYGKGFELRYDPTVEEATLFENSVTAQVELNCEPR